MRKINDLIVHCAATYDTMDIGAKEIRKVHVDENGWKDIGYHFVIRRDGTVEKGRDVSVIGAHVLNHNANSIGICLAGGLSKKDGKTVNCVNYTPEQYKSLYTLLLKLKSEYPHAGLHGHQDYANKFCPGFDVREWWTGYTGKKWEDV